MKNFSSYVLVAIKGFLMGAANVIPGVSGGTIAFLTGIYEELINSIKSITGSSLKLLFQGKFAQFWSAINGNFLLALAIGIVASIFSLAKAMTFLLENFPIRTWSFFLGLVLVSTVYMIRQLKDLKVQHWVSMVFGVVCGVVLCLLAPAQTSNSPLFLFICGAIAMCTMVLPGISGSFVLVLLGKYAFILEAINNLDIVVLLIFAAGAIIGIMGFSHGLSWLLKRAHNATMMFLAGLMLGSLVKVWPWQSVQENGSSQLLWPTQYPGDPAIGGAIHWAIMGILLVIAIEGTARQHRKRRDKKSANAAS